MDIMFFGVTGNSFAIIEKKNDQIWLCFNVIWS